MDALLWIGPNASSSNLNFAGGHILNLNYYWMLKLGEDSGWNIAVIDLLC